ncbi:hypothetical protein LXL04_022159 [Taraxacum kok-saghyz]
MGIMKVMVVLLVLFNFCFPASFAPLGHKFNLGSSSSSSSCESNNSIPDAVNQSKFVYAGARGGGGRRLAKGGGSKGGGRSISSPKGGGAGIIVAGVGQRNNNHHGAAGVGSRCRKGMLLIDVATILTSILLSV